MTSLLLALVLAGGVDGERVAYKFVGEKYVRSISGSELLAQALDAQPQIEWAVVDELHPNEAAPAWQTVKVGASRLWHHATGAGVTVAILDSGIDTDHPYYQDKLVAGWSFITGTSNVEDDHGHGTQVAGSASVVAPGAKIMPIKVSGSNGSAYSSTLYNGLVWAADNGAQVANMSFMVSSSSLVKSGMSYFRSKGGVVTVSAGNYNQRDLNPDNADCLTVAATDASDNKASWSNYGTVVDLTAPGVGVLTTTRTGWGLASGTSFSAPTVAGGVALVLSLRPGLTPVEAQEAVKKWAKDLGALGWDEKFGMGRLDALASVASLGDIPPVLNVESPVPDMVFSDTLTLKATADDPDGAIDRVKVYVGGIMYRTILGSSMNLTWATGHWPKRSYQITLQAVSKDGTDVRKTIEVNK